MNSPLAPSTNKERILEEVERWLKEVVIGLELCPFARYPHEQQQVRFVVYDGQADEQLLLTLLEELKQLERSEPSENYIETTLICCSSCLGDFIEFNDFVGLANQLIESEGYEGMFQLASFHPHYQFEGCQADEPSNLTNRAPVPIFHLIREASLERVLKHYPDPEGIFERNINCVENLSEKQLHQLFPWIFH